MRNMQLGQDALHPRAGEVPVDEQRAGHAHAGIDHAHHGVLQVDAGVLLEHDDAQHHAAGLDAAGPLEQLAAHDASMAQLCIGGQMGDMETDFGKGDKSRAYVIDPSLRLAMPRDDYYYLYASQVYNRVKGSDIVADLKNPKVHWVIEISNVLCQGLVAFATVILFS